MILAPSTIGSSPWDWRRTCIFGVVNVTPDSFSDGGRYVEPTAAVDHGLELVAQGADVLDVGGESTRPGAAPVPVGEELERVLPVIEALAQRTDRPISVDTYKAGVARAAVGAGATIINDVSGGLLDPDMLAVMAETGATAILGHLRGRPATMQEGVAFSDVVAEVEQELKTLVRAAVIAGVKADRIWIDPGLGFGKLPEHSLALLSAAERLREAVGYPVLVGPSRKGFIGAVTGLPVDRREMGTAGAVASAIQAGADAVRVHDVAALLPAIQVADAIRRGRP